MATVSESPDVYRLLVTGSREYDDRLSLRAAMARVLDSLPDNMMLIVVHGGEEIPEESWAKSDRITGEWALEMKAAGLPVDQEAHPADWTGPCRDKCDHGGRKFWRGLSMCPAAGPYRNEEMCQAGASEGLAALRVGTRSTGTRGCMLLMRQYGIQFSIVVQGSARGLPAELIQLAGQQGQGRPKLAQYQPSAFS